MTVVECPAEGCRRRFPVEKQRIGRNVYCIYCGTRMTARPAGVTEALEHKQAELVRNDSSPFPATGSLPLRVMVDNVRSLWNVGSIFRTADACGVERLDLCGITGTPPRAEIAKTALGAEDHVAWRYWAEPNEALDAARADGFTPVVLETGGESEAVDRIHWPRRTFLVIGNEVAGVGPSLRLADALPVHIPMRGIKESLNVAVAFGIAAHAASRALLHFEETPPQEDDPAGGEKGKV